MSRLCLVLACLFVAGCPWRGVDDVVEDANLEIVVSGVQAGDQLRLAVAGAASRLILDEDHGQSVRLFARVPPGAQEASLWHGRGSERRCLVLPVQGGGGLVSWSVDVRLMPPCEPLPSDGGPSSSDGGDRAASDAGDPGHGDDGGADGGDDDDDDGGDDDDDGGDGGDDGEIEQDAGHGEGLDAGAEAEEDGGPDSGSELDDDGDEATGSFVRLREVVHQLSCISECEEQTEVDDDGVATLQTFAGEEHEGVLGQASFEALVSDAVSVDADLLFSGEDSSCPTGEPLSTESVKLERRIIHGEAHLTERVEVSGCGGIADILRQHLAAAREAALSATELGDASNLEE